MNPVRNLSILGWRIYLILALLTGVGITWLDLRSPSELGKTVIGGFSLLRLIIDSILVLVLLALGGLLIESWANRKKADDRLVTLSAFLQNPVRRNAILLFCGILSLCGLYLLTFMLEIPDGYPVEVFERAFPVILWLVLLCVLTLVWLGVPAKSASLRKILPAQRSLWIACAAIAGILIAWIGFARYYVPELIDRPGWNSLGVPIVEWQVVLAWLAGVSLMGFVYLFHRLRPRYGFFERRAYRWLDAALVVLIWAAAGLVWESIEAPPSWFLSPRLYPNFETYPYSDARLYDTVAQDALVGGGFRFFRSSFVRRPLHGIYLLTLHALAGESYDRVVAVQVLVLACLPALLFLLLSAVYNRVSGLVGAGLVIFREANSIALAETITASHVKLLLVDVLTALFTVLFATVCWYWLRRIERDRLAGFCSGVILGLTMLIRLETLTFIPVVLGLVGLLISPGRRLRRWLRGSIPFLLGISLVITPWVGRNWLKTGLIFIDSPGHRQSLILQRFKDWTRDFQTPTPVAPENPTPAAGEIGPAPIPTAALTAGAEQPVPEATIEPTGGQPVTGEDTSGMRLSKDPNSLAGLATYFTVHYLNSQIQMLLIYPTTLRPVDSFLSFYAHRSLSRLWGECCALKGYIRRLPYWHKWLGDFQAQSSIPLLMNGLILAVGVQRMWVQHRWIGLLPLGLSVAYLTANAIYRNSGGRYILPVDWASLFYYSVGLMSLTAAVFKRLSTKKDFEWQVGLQMEGQEGIRMSERSIQRIVVGLSAVGLLAAVSLPIVEAAIPMRYTPERHADYLQKVISAAGLDDEYRAELQSFLTQGGQVMAGRVLYPQYFPKNYGAPGDRNGPLAPQKQPRLVFYLAGENGTDMDIIVDRKPAPFPNGSDGLVFLCPAPYPYYPEVLALAVFEPSGALRDIIPRGPFPHPAVCPSP